MAQVLPPVLQPSNSIPMMHNRSTSSDAFHAAPGMHSPQARQQPVSTTRIANFNQHVGYRGTASPMYAYAQTPHLKQENRATSAPGNPFPLRQQNASVVNRQRFPASSSTSTSSSTASSGPSLLGQQKGSLDDFVLTSAPRLPELDMRSATNIDLSTSLPDLSFSTFDASPKPSPDRYRRSTQRPPSAGSSSGLSQTTSSPSSPAFPRSGSPSFGEISVQGPALTRRPVNQPQRYHRSLSSSNLQSRSSDDPMPLPQPTAAGRAGDASLVSRISEQAKRYRRRSLSGIDATGPTSKPVPVFSSQPVQSGGRLHGAPTDKASHRGAPWFG